MRKNIIFLKVKFFLNKKFKFYILYEFITNFIVDDMLIQPIVPKK